MSDTAAMSASPPRRRAIRLHVVRPRIGLAIGVTILVVMVIMSFLAPTLIGESANEVTGHILDSPSPAHPFGTDDLGRDVFVRTFVAARYDYLIAVVGVGFSLLVGGTLGTATALARHRIWGTVMMRVTDALIAVPFTLLILLLVITIGEGKSYLGLPAGIPPIMISIFLIGWTIYARLARAESLSMRDRDFVMAARVMGYGRARIVFRHIFPTVMRTCATYSVSDCILVIGFVAGLPFLGAGVTPPTAEWGAMMYEGRGLLSTAWWIVVFPGAGLVLTAVAVALIADAILADGPDPMLGTP